MTSHQTTTPAHRNDACGAPGRNPAGQQSARVGGAAAGTNALACQVSRSLSEAGFSPHHCLDRHSPSEPGGVCLTHVQASAQGGYPDGVTVSWTTRDHLSADAARWATCLVLTRVMNQALGTIVRTLGYDPRPIGTSGAWIITAELHHGTEGGAS